MSRNTNLSAAKNAKNDEFYTQYADIAREMEAYLDYDADAFRGKSVLLPCDDPEWSNFTKYFAENFERLGLKKLVSTSFAFESKKISADYLPGFESLTAESIRSSPKFDKGKERSHGKIFVLDEDTNRSGRIDIEDLKWEYLKGDGDFRSAEVCKLRDEADVIVTNPPFSLFREFLAWILEGEKEGESLDRINRIGRIEGAGKGLAAKNAKDAKVSVGSRGGSGTPRPTGDIAKLVGRDVLGAPPKKFAIIGNQNAITYKEVFPFIMENRLWLGATGFSSDMVFAVPKGTVVLEAYKKKAERMGYVGDYTRLGNSCWFTNIEHGRRHTPLNLMTMRENVKYSRHKEVKGVGYRRYDNYDALEVPYTDAIPSDCDWVMGVPISFLDKYCPEQFEIVGIAKAGAGDPALRTKVYPEQIQVAKNGRETRVTKLNDGPVLKIDAPIDRELYYKVGKDLFVQAYARILIRRRNP